MMDELILAVTVQGALLRAVLHLLAVDGPEWRDRLACMAGIATADLDMRPWPDTPEAEAIRAAAHGRVDRIARELHATIEGADH